MDDEVFKMVNIEGQVGFRRAGFMVFGLVCVCWVFVGFCLEGECFYCFVSSNNRKQKYRAVSWQRNSGSGEEKKFRDGEKRKKVAKNTGQ